MSKQHRIITRKTIFQVRYKPQLRFYDEMFSVAQNFEGFPHWSTNRLAVTLRDFEFQHSITIAHGSTSYESDSPEASAEDRQIAAIVTNLPQYVKDGEVLRVGLRHKYLVPMTMTQSELEAVMNGKILSLDFLQVLGSEPDDMTIVLTGTVSETSYRVTLGPMTKAELPRFLEYNAEQHVEPKDREAVLARIHDQLPDVSLYIDLDCYKVADEMNLQDVCSFVADASSFSKRFVESVVSFVFEVDV